MLIIIGLVIVLGSVVGGYLMAGGNLLVLNQPSEFVVIGGSAIGSLVISTPSTVLKAIVTQIKGVMGAGFTKADYVDLLSLLYLVFKQVQQSGVMSLEAHFEDPSNSPILSRYPRFLSRHDAVDFLADSAKVIIVGGIAAHDLEALMDEDLKVHHDEALRPSVVLTKIGDALPGLGIVAAVLGVVITMGHIDGPVEEIGHHVGAALIGTFLGICCRMGSCSRSRRPRAARRGRSVLLSVHQGRTAGRLQGQPPGDCRGIRATRAATLRASLVQRDGTVLPRCDEGAR